METFIELFIVQFKADLPGFLKICATIAIGIYILFKLLTRNKR